MKTLNLVNMFKRRLAFGDVHGAWKALDECLQKANYDPNSDLLISIGDICDGWSEVYEIVDFLTTIENKIIIRGNHDDWFITWLNRGKHPVGWLQGGYGTLKSYVNHSERECKIVQPFGAYESNLTRFDLPESHIELFNNTKYYHIIDDEKLFVHGGFNRHYLITEHPYNDEHVLMWDRDLWMSALSFEAFYRGINSKTNKFKNKNNFKEIYIGHTATTNFDNDYPMKAANIWNIDTGAGFDGKLSLIDIDTKQVWQSSPVKTLYENERGRN